MTRRHVTYHNFDYIVPNDSTFLYLMNAEFVYMVYDKNGNPIKFDFNTITKKLFLLGENADDAEYIEFEERGILD